MINYQSFTLCKTVSWFFDGRPGNSNWIPGKTRNFLTPQCVQTVSESRRSARDCTRDVADSPASSVAVKNCRMKLKCDELFEIALEYPVVRRKQWKMDMKPKRYKSSDSDQGRAGLIEAGDQTVRCEIHKFLFGIKKNCLYCREVPVQVWTGREGSRKLRLSDFQTVGT